MLYLDHFSISLTIFFYFSVFPPVTQEKITTNRNIIFPTKCVARQYTANTEISKKTSDPTAATTATRLNSRVEKSRDISPLWWRGMQARSKPTIATGLKFAMAH
jgi:hypothetical protein